MTTNTKYSPDGWTDRQLIELADFLDHQRRPVKSADRARAKGIYPYYGATGVIDYVDEYIFDEELVLLGEDGENILSRQLPQAFRIEGKSWVNNHAHVLRPKRNIDATYLSLALERLDFSAYNSGSAQPKLTKGTCEAIVIPIPDEKHEQNAVAQALRDIGDLILSLDALIAKKRDIKQGAMQICFGDTLSNSDQDASIGADCHLHARIGWQGLTTAEYKKSGDFLLVTGTDFIDGRIDLGRCAYVDEWRFRQDRKIQLKPNDVLVTKDGTIGKSAFVDGLPLPATLNSGVFVVRPKSNKINKKFLFWIFQSPIFAKFIDELQAGSTIAHLYQKDFVKFRFRLPGAGSQAEIADILFGMTEEVEGLLDRRSKMEMIRQGMMQQLLTGRIRLA